MKASVKVREGQRPLLRAKAPVQFGGLPFFSGISVGDERELALHVGTNMEAGPSCRLSYRPNDPQSPLAVLLKTGFGLWGSPNAAPFTIAAEFSIARRENLAFTLRLKPRLGNFSFRKHFVSTSGGIGGTGESLRSSSHVGMQVDVGQEEVEVATVERAGDVMSRGLGQGETVVYESDHECGLSPLGLGQVSGLKVRERKCYLASEGVSPGGLQHSGDGALELETPGVQEIGGGAMEILTRQPSENGDRAVAPETSEGSDSGAIVGQFDHSESRNIGFLQSWSGHGQRSWGLSVHSAIPLGRQAMGRVQWGMRLPSKAFEDGGHHDGGSFYGLKLPVLVLDKISISTVDTERKLQYSKYLPDMGPLSYGMRSFEEPMDDGSRLGIITSICCSMRNQLHNLHSDNRALKKIIEDMKMEMEQTSWSDKRITQNRPTQEEDSIRSQLFEELKKKTGSRTSAKDHLGSLNFAGENKEVSGAQKQESIFDSLPSEVVALDRKSSDLGAKSRGSPERSAK